MRECTILDNGIRIITETMPSFRSVTLGVWVNAGSRHDPPKRQGIAHFLEHMMFKGTQKRSAIQIAKEIDALGGIINAQTSKEYTLYYTKVVDEHLDKAADILFDVFLNRTIDSEEMEREKQVVFQEISMNQDTPDDYINDLFSQAVFPSNALGRPILGDQDSVGAMQQQDLFDFISSAYDPSKIVIVATGNCEHKRIVSLVSCGFEKIKAIPPGPRDETPGYIGGIKAIHEKDLEQEHIIVGTKGMAISDRNRWTYILLNNILGGSMSSMLFQEIREKRGLVYSVYSYLLSHSDCGCLAVYAGTGPDNTNKTLELISEQMHRLTRGDTGGIPLEDVKSQIKGNLLLSRESTESRMSFHGRNELYFNREVTLDEILSKIQAVTLDDIVETAESIFSPGLLNLVTLGSLARDKVAWG